MHCSIGRCYLHNLLPFWYKWARFSLLSPPPPPILLASNERRAFDPPHLPTAMAFLLPWLPFLSPSGSPLPITYICLGRLAVKVPSDNLLLLVVPVPNRVLSRNREKRSREAWGSGKRYLSLSLQASLGRFSRLCNETQTRGASTERTSCSLAVVMSLAEFLKLLSLFYFHNAQ